MPGKVIVLGSLMTDLVGYASRLPLPGESLPGSEFQTFQGGKGCNQAVAASRCGASVALLGRVGADGFGEAFFPTLASEQIDATHISRDSETGTGVALILIGADSGQNMIVTLPRANLTITPDQTIHALDALVADYTQTASGPPIFLAQLETNVAAVEAAIRHAHTLGMTTILNTAPIPSQPLAPDLFPLLDLLIANEVEAAALTGIAVSDPASAHAACQRSLALGVGAAIVTLGAQGAVWAAQRGILFTPGEHQSGILTPFTVRAIDATAAGDAFCGALAAGLANGLPANEALRQANAAGALTTTRKGALPSLPTATEIDTLLASNNR